MPVERVGGAFWAPSKDLVGNAFLAFSTGPARSTGSSLKDDRISGAKSDDLGVTHTYASPRRDVLGPSASAGPCCAR
jgi:hypothetical protein